ncbi:hypothetical protein BRYFOR_09080 [Marvinbryantia formatexigens DSM 14469]|uniref:Uncharacterized protein n=1 Tax=Marvinbryantia formatexigens DSM 14469 TaxID=478749 RepID=C6LK94_9FIRM|nr:hypothetical protein BRYFOR_09080 [Marvinbryantia formatexigens DSM 14469]
MLHTAFYAVLHYSQPMLLVRGLALHTAFYAVLRPSQLTLLVRGLAPYASSKRCLRLCKHSAYIFFRLRTA